MLHSIIYHFTQRFCVTAHKAYEWCTDYNPQDQALMHENATREVQRVSENVIVLIDTFNGKDGSIRKEKLVHLYPNQLTWTSTHLTGPNKYSQFLYQITPEGRNTSRLDFTGSHIEHSEEKFGKKGIRALANRLRMEDSAVWKLLASEMEKAFKENAI